MTSTTRYAPDVDAMPHMSRVMLGYRGDLYMQTVLYTGCRSAALAAVLRALLATPSYEKAGLEDVALMQARRELRQLNTRLPTLHLIAGLAPLMGLLGTVVGMVKAFQQVATAEGAVNPALLASSIWEALLTTVAGLVVAIPVPAEPYVAYLSSG